MGMRAVTIKRIPLMKKVEKYLLAQPTLTLEEIAGLAGISPITIYRKFDTRDGLIRSICEYIIDEISDLEKSMSRYRGDYKSSVENMVRLLYPHITSIRFLFQLDTFVNSQKRIKDVYEKVLVLRKKFEHYMGLLVKKGQAEGVLRKDLSTRWITMFLVGYFFSLRALEGTARAEESMVEDIVTTMVDGVVKK
jgi:TetR/AcrR family transcriptional regulator, mexCD-oprJ operon repressor